MATTSIIASGVKIWRTNNLPDIPSPIDPTGPTNPLTGQLLGYLTKHVSIKAGLTNQGDVRVWDQSQSPGMYYELDAGEVLSLDIDSSILLQLSGSAAGQEVYVVMTLQETAF